VTTSEELSGTIARRAKPAYPSWMRVVCAAILVLQAAKVPSLNAFVTTRAADEAGLQGQLSDDLFRTSIYTGVGVALLFAAIVGCLALYSVAKFVYRRAPDRSRAFEHTSSGPLYSFAFALLWPDLWAAFGIIQPLALPLFWATHLALVALIAWRTRGVARPLPHYAACIGITLLGVLL
jgi:hypothetical protein